MENTTEPTPVPEQTQPAPTIDQDKLARYMEKLKMEQNFPLALIGGLVSAIVSALIWAAITVSTGYQIGYMAIGVGLIVAFTVKFLGKGLDPIFGITGAALALFGCLLGNFFSVVGFAAHEEGLGYFQVLSIIDFSMIPEIMMDTFSPMDILFYGLAGYEGYKFAFRTITEEEIVANAGK